MCTSQRCSMHLSWNWTHSNLMFQSYSPFLDIGIVEICKLDQKKKNMNKANLNFDFLGGWGAKHAVEIYHALFIPSETLIYLSLDKLLIDPEKKYFLINRYGLDILCTFNRNTSLLFLEHSPFPCFILYQTCKKITGLTKYHKVLQSTTKSTTKYHNI